MASSAKDIQLRELKDMVSQLKTMVSEQTEMIWPRKQSEVRNLISPPYY